MTYIEQNLKSRLSQIEADFKQKMVEEEKRIRAEFEEKTDDAPPLPADIQTSMAEKARKHRIIK